MTTVLLREMGGFVRMYGYPGNTGAHVQRDPGLSGAWARLDRVLDAAGCRAFQGP